MIVGVKNVKFVLKLVQEGRSWDYKCIWFILWSCGMGLRLLCWWWILPPRLQVQLCTWPRWTSRTRRSTTSDSTTPTATSSRTTSTTCWATAGWTARTRRPKARRRSWPRPTSARPATSSESPLVYLIWRSALIWQQTDDEVLFHPESDIQTCTAFDPTVIFLFVLIKKKMPMTVSPEAESHLQMFCFLQNPKIQR